MLATRPRPVWPLAFRIRAAPSVALFVRGLTGRQDAGAFWDPYGVPEEVARGMAARQLVTVALCDQRARCLVSYDQTGLLDEQELMRLALSVADGLNVVSPAMWRCNVDAWRRKLRAGAAHPTNVSDMINMAESGEPAADLGSRAWRPDRYYGAALCELTDGQILAYDAAQLAYKDIVPKAGEQQWPKPIQPKSLT